MTKTEFNNRLFSEFSATEIALINCNVYHNEDHIDYYLNFHSGMYAWCFDYLVKNRHLLTLKHTPRKWKEKEPY